MVQASPAASVSRRFVNSVEVRRDEKVVLIAGCKMVVPRNLSAPFCVKCGKPLSSLERPGTRICTCCANGFYN